MTDLARASQTSPKPDDLAKAASATVRVGTAGWSVPANVSNCFPADGTHLQRYAARLGAAEINSSFYRPHRQATYERWAASVPEAFRFSVKLPKAISHAASMEQEADIARFAGEVGGLGEKLGVVLVQFPPKRDFNVAAADTLFTRLAAALGCPIACEPRHASWFTEAASDLLVQHKVARVAADPALVPHANEPGGWSGLRYYRLHGSPVIYRSSYDDAALTALCQSLIEEQRAGADVWCIFDNTASSAAPGNALTVADRIA